MPIYNISTVVSTLTVVSHELISRVTLDPLIVDQWIYSVLSLCPPSGAAEGVGGERGEDAGGGPGGGGGEAVFDAGV